MSQVYSYSESGPSDMDIARLGVEAVRRAEAMGIVEPGPPVFDVSVVRRLANGIRRAGIATGAADILRNVAAPTSRELAGLLEMIGAALEASPAPSYEWKGLGRVFSPEELASLLDVSQSSLKRYQSGERPTPDPVAARLHFLALVVGDLAGSYNDIGIRRWFQRRRTLLDGRAPEALLGRDWDPDDDGPRRVRALARSLVTLDAS